MSLPTRLVAGLPILSHYSIHEFYDVDFLREVFPKAMADEMNWLFASTSGVHGSYATLDDIEIEYRAFDTDPKGFLEERGIDEFVPRLTLLLVKPRLVQVCYGNVPVRREDIGFLRLVITSTFNAVAHSQRHNLMDGGNP